AVLAHPVFTAGQAATDWIERDQIGRDLTPAVLTPGDNAEQPAAVEHRYTLEVNGKRFNVRLFDDAGAQATTNNARPAAPRRALPKHGGSPHANGNGALTSPIQGTVLRVAVAPGAAVAAGDLICVIEAMKMENEITAPRDGTVQDLPIAPGQTVKIGEPLATIG
ncbi:MAG: biotin/lipoyl-containing protein, partial [Thermomicrobiales bacterium]